MKKKLCAGLLVTSMILSSSVMAFAAAGDSTSHGLLTSVTTVTVTGGQLTTDQTIAGTGSVDVGLINVDMPTSTKIILNPNKVEGKDQVLSTIIPFKNYSNVGIDVKLVQATTTVQSGSNMLFVPKANYDTTVDLVSQSLAGTPNEFGDAFKDKKFGAIYLERYIVSETKLTTAKKLSLSDSVLRSVGIATGSDLVATDPAHPEWAPYVGIDVSGNSLSASDSPISLGKVSNSPKVVSDTVAGGIITSDDSLLESGSMMFLRFNGDLSPYVMWGSGDTINTTMTFRLQPANVTTDESLYGTN